jgi:hypothetical protein
VHFLLVGSLQEEQTSVLVESVIFVCGGIMLTIAHWKNYQLEGAC